LIDSLIGALTPTLAIFQLYRGAVNRGRTGKPMAKRKRINRQTIYLQITAQKTKDRTTRTRLKTRRDLRCCGKVCSSTITSICWSNGSWVPSSPIFWKFLLFIGILYPNRAKHSI